MTPEPFNDEWLIHQLRTRPRRDGWHTIMIAAAERLEQLTRTHDCWHARIDLTTQPTEDTP